jgi:hypothetical protein
VNRPHDWAPLRGGDPTPGDPDVVGDEARHLGDVAAELRTQISRLRRIGQDGDLRGQYADRLREAAGELVGHLETVERRYERVAAALRRWEPQLRDSQRRADRIRGEARALDDERRSLHRQAAGLGGGSLPDDPTPAQQARFDADQAAAERIRRRLDAIEADLRRLDRELDGVQGDVRQAGDAVAGDIRAAVDDGVTDSGWDDFTGAFVEAWRAVDSFVDQHWKAIEKVLEALSWVATALAVAAIFFPVLAPFAAIAAGLVFLGQGLLFTTGHGSLTDVLLATFSLLTLGVGTVAAAAIKGARTATLAAASTRAAQRVSAGTRSARRQLGRQLGQGTLTRGQRRAAREQLAELKARPARTAADYLERPLPRTERWEALQYGGDLDNATHAKDLVRMVGEFPELAGVARPGLTALQVARGSFTAGSAADLGSLVAGESKILPEKPYSETFEEFKDSWDPRR